jgi:3-hydroxyisobutyrate dehydrogenase
MVQAKEHRVGIVGLGQMGLPMCARLVERGFAVTATDVVAEREAVTAGARWPGSAAEVAAEVGVVLTVLPGAAEVTAVAGPLIAALESGGDVDRHEQRRARYRPCGSRLSGKRRAAVHRPDLDCRNVANPALSLRLPL